MKLEPISQTPLPTLGAPNRVKLTFFGANLATQQKLKEARAAAVLASPNAAPISILDIDPSPRVVYTSMSSTTIGRGSSNPNHDQPAVALSGLMLFSKIHCAIHAIPEPVAPGADPTQPTRLTFVVQDLGSSNGTCVKDVFLSSVANAVSEASVGAQQAPFVQKVLSEVEAATAGSLPFSLPHRPSFTVSPNTYHRVSSTQVVSFGEHDAVLLQIEDVLFPTFEYAVEKKHLSVVSDALCKLRSDMEKQHTDSGKAVPHPFNASVHNTSSTLTANTPKADTDGEDLLALISTPQPASKQYNVVSLASTQHDSQQPTCSPAPVKPPAMAAASPLPETQLISDPSPEGLPNTLLMPEPAGLPPTLQIANNAPPDTLLPTLVCDEMADSPISIPVQVANGTPQRGAAPPFLDDSDDDEDATPPKAVSPGSNPLLSVSGITVTTGIILGTSGTVRVNNTEDTTDEDDDVAPPPNVSTKSSGGGGGKRQRDEGPSLSPGSCSTHDEGPLPPPPRGVSPAIQHTMIVSKTPSISPNPPPARGAAPAQMSDDDGDQVVVPPPARGGTATAEADDGDAPTPKDESDEDTHAAPVASTLPPRGAPAPADPPMGRKAPTIVPGTPVVQADENSHSNPIPTPQPSTPAPVSSRAPPPPPAVVPTTATHKWQFKVDLRKSNKNDKAWQDYPDQDSEKIEAFFTPFNSAPTKKEKAKYERANLNPTYGIDFDDLLQYRLDDETRQRPIRRIPK